MPKTYFEELDIGHRFEGGCYVVDLNEMLAYARKWDPRPIHLDEAAGREAGFGGVIASGAYTTAIFTLLNMRGREVDGEHAVIAGIGSEMRLPAPVRGGDTLHHDAEIVEKRVSASRPNAGIVRTRARLTNQRDEIAFEATTVTLVAKRTQLENGD